MSVIGIGSRITIDEFAFERSIDQEGELPCGDGLWLADPCGQTSIAGPERRVRPPETHGGHPEGWRRLDWPTAGSGS